MQKFMCRFNNDVPVIKSVQFSDTFLRSMSRPKHSKHFLANLDRSMHGEQFAMAR
ncbi:hypothetical protein ACFL6D_03070 [Spirochaetota bacterium]